MSDGAGTTTLTLAEFQGAVYFRPPADYNGAVSLSVVAVSQEASSGSTALSSPVTLDFTLQPVSEEASSEVQNINLIEFTNSTVDDTRAEYLGFMIITLHMSAPLFLIFLFLLVTQRV